MLANETDIFNALKGRSVLVSGAGALGGIGFAIAKAFTQAAATVFITSTTDRIFERAKEIAATGFVCDLTDEAAALKLISQLSKLDILVNNAGMSSISEPNFSDESRDLTEVSGQGWHRGLSRNLDTTFNLTKAALPLLRKSDAGRIINLSSITGPVMVMANNPVYATAKAGLIGFTKSLAVDEARYQITANAILPGWIKTDTQSEHEYQQGLKSALKRSGTPAEVASLAIYLATPLAGYLTGQAIAVDGANSIMEERG